MGTKASLSEARTADAGLQKEQRAYDTADQIARMRDYAMDTPEKRGAVLEALEEYTRKHQGSEGATAASRAITTILTVSMLEALQEG